MIIISGSIYGYKEVMSLLDCAPGVLTGGFREGAGTTSPPLDSAERAQAVEKVGGERRHLQRRLRREAVPAALLAVGLATAALVFWLLS